MREDVQQDLRIGAGVEVAQIIAHEVFLEWPGVGQIAVVRERDAIGRIHIERLGLGRGGAARGGVAHMADAHIALEVQHVAGVKDIAHQPVVFAQIQLAAVTGDHAGGVLAAVLEHGQAVVNGLVDRLPGHDTDYAAHRPAPQPADRCPGMS